MATSITTHPIADLDYPTVTVCPPKGSNTALNYDLMKNDNSSLTNEDREHLKNEASKLFLEPSHSNYISKMLAIANPENMKENLEGFQSVPRTYRGNKGIEIRMWNNNGTWHTPGFMEEWNPNYFKEDIDYFAVIEFPNDLNEKIRYGSLVIELDVNTKEEEGWQEEVTFQQGKYKLYQEKKTWADAEDHCQSKGSHLASILTEEEQNEVAALASVDSHVWLGGTDQEIEGVWKWTDASTWGYTRWQSGYGNKGHAASCLGIWGGNWWNDWSCSNEYPFICHSPPDRVLRGKNNLTLKFTKEELLFTSVTVGYHYRANKGLLDSWKDKRMTGFQMNWRIENPQLVMPTSDIGRSLHTPGFGGDNFDESFYKGGRDYKTTLNIPDTMLDIMGNGTLVIHLEVNTREEKGWEEDVLYSMNPKWGANKFKYFPIFKNWTDAEAYCQSE